MKYFSHLNTATQIIQQYQGHEPLHHYLKKFFGQHKKFGSKDRKRISHLCYSFYRVGRAFKTTLSADDMETSQQIILIGLFLCSNTSDELLEVMKPLWNEKINSSLHEKVAIINLEGTSTVVELHQIFPTQNELSNGINRESFGLSHLYQPDLFIRIRPGYTDSVLRTIKEREIPYEFVPTSAVRLPNGTKVEAIFAIDKEIVVQDLNSQRIGEFLKTVVRPNGVISIWDCCAASGGKSILAKDILGNIDLTVSDVRPSILANLKKRFAIAGISKYKSFVADLSTALGKLPTANYDLVLADLPCTGSGTWGRTPEQLYFFKSSAIKKYSDLQKKILVNLVPHLKERGQLLYTTCSVFEEENEEIIQFIMERFPLKMVRMELLKGYERRADTMFAAFLSRL